MAAQSSYQQFGWWEYGRTTLSGKVTDSSGKLPENATFMICEAGVKKGYNTFCPSCYVDCGKRAITDRAGAFTFTNLDPDLWFNLLVIRDGYTAAFVGKVDPARQPVATAALSRRAPVDDIAMFTGDDALLPFPL